MVEMDGVAGEEEEEGREGGDTSAQLLQARHRMETRGRVVSNIIPILRTLNVLNVVFRSGATDQTRTGVVGRDGEGRLGKRLGRKRRRWTRTGTPRSSVTAAVAVRPSPSWTLSSDLSPYTGIVLNVNLSLSEGQ